MKRLGLALCAALLASAAAPVSAGDTRYPPEAIVGEWWTEGRTARVRFGPSPDGTYAGVITWSTTPQNKDEHNKDPKLRDRLIVGIVLMWHLRYEDGAYVDGYVYDPENGSTFRMKAEVLGPESLKVRGYVGISLFGENQTWTRVH
jgi:uncharacterized protein (DUF2147 family)